MPTWEDMLARVYPLLASDPQTAENIFDFGKVYILCWLHRGKTFTM